MILSQVAQPRKVLVLSFTRLEKGGIEGQTPSQTDLTMKTLFRRLFAYKRARFFGLGPALF